MPTLAVIDHTTYAESVRKAFLAVDGPSALAGFDAVLLKPNLVNASPFPVTTHPDFTAAVLEVVAEHTDATIVIAEGCGAASQETGEIFNILGYTQLAERYGVDLVDLNQAPLVSKINPDCKVFPEMHLPEIAFTHCIVSLPVLKAHSLATMTGTLKNMMGFPPPSHYQGGGWKKATFHARMHASIKDLCSYVSPHLTIMDATVGLADYHLGGAECAPHRNKILAGTDALELDRAACGLLDIDWRDVGHLR